jgi:hypothetical protein
VVHGSLETLVGDGPQTLKHLRALPNITPRDYPLTDIGNAEGFVEHHEDRVRYEHRQSRFYIFSRRTIGDQMNRKRFGGWRWTPLQRRQEAQDGFFSHG